jgi:hypothetical protein
MIIVRAAKTMVDLGGLVIARSVPDVSETRQRDMAAYLTVTACNVPGAVVADALGVSRQYLSRVLREIEDMRDDPAIDAALTRIERRLGHE